MKARRRALFEGAALTLLLAPVLGEWARYAWSVNRLSYVLAVPVLAAALVSLETVGRRSVARAQTDSERARGRALGDALLLASALLLAAGSLSATFTVSVAAVPVAIASRVLAWGGLAAARRHGWALAFLCFVVPLPMPLLDRVQPALVEASGATAVALLRPLDDASWLGSTLTFGPWTIEVAEACSGSGTLLTLVVLTFFLCGLFRLTPTRTLLALVLAIPFAIAVNGLRIALSAVCLDRFGREMADGTPHEVLGLVLTVGASATIAWALGHLDRAGGSGRRNGTEGDARKGEGAAA